MTGPVAGSLTGPTPRVGFADAHDPRVAEAVARLRATGEVAPVLIGADPGRYAADVEQLPVPDGSDAVSHLAGLVTDGALDAGIAGSLSTSAAVLRAVIASQRRAELVSSCFVLRHRTGWVTYADCAVVPEPTVAQLAAIARMAAAHHAEAFGEHPRIAMLSFSTRSADHARVQRVREAVDLVRTEDPALLVEGEIQFDVAVDAEVGRRKLPGSAVAGVANVLVFPSLEAGNIAYKVAERIGGARSLGSFVLGLERPFVDLSRGYATADIVQTVRLLGAMVRRRTVAGQEVRA